MLIYLFIFVIVICLLLALILTILALKLSREIKHSAVQSKNSWQQIFTNFEQIRFLFSSVLLIKPFVEKIIKIKKATNSKRK